MVAALKKAVPRGTSFGAPTPLEVELASKVKRAFPSMELVRMVSSGTEAVMGAIRAARGYTGRDKIIKFEGCYHGHGDSLLVKAGSGATTFGIPDSLGVPEDLAKHTLTATYNDLESVQALVNQYPEQIACIIVEPTAGNMGVVLPERGFLEGFRKICDEEEIVLIFDEVITGFRVAYGGAQELYRVKVDLTCLGKIIGGGLPVGAYGGKKAIMDRVSPLGGVYQAGTLSGNPLAMTAGIATLRLLRSKKDLPGFRGKDLFLTEMIRMCRGRGIACHHQSDERVVYPLFYGGSGQGHHTAKMSDTKRFAQFFIEMMEQGSISAFPVRSVVSLSGPHPGRDLDRTIEACDTAFQRI